jgi:hypothetical protein
MSQISLSREYFKLTEFLNNKFKGKRLDLNRKETCQANQTIFS